jgi:signal-transduction protein with cAMP-binding, CBS, and nucleotidyltransferase domain
MIKDFNVSVMAVFSRLVRDIMRGAPPTVLPAIPCGEAMRIMRDYSVSSIVVISSEGRPIGILTEQDVVRRIAFLNPATTPVSEVMSSPVKTIHDDDYLFHGIAIMNRFGLGHLPALDRNGDLTGILHLNDALKVTVTRVTELIERLTHEETLEGLKLVKKAEVLVVDALLKDRIPANEIQILLTHINNDIYRRVQSIIFKELAEEGWGEPPVEFDMIVMGSGGRGESFLYPDQDNGFILMDYPESQHATVEAYFMEVAKRMSVMLDTVGIPICRGNVMAINPQWRKTLSQWFLQINTWLDKPSHITLRYADIFFDFQHNSGREELAVRLRRHVSRAVRQNHVFLREMQLVQQDHGVALGKFGRLALEQESSHKGKINLKYHGILPLVEAIRLLALREGVARTSTLGRIEALSASGILSSDEKDYLTSAFHSLTMLILRQQIHDFKKGQEVSQYVDPDKISAREKDILIDSLRAIRALRNRVHSEFTGDVF